MEIPVIITATRRRVQGAIHADSKHVGDLSGEAECQRCSLVGIELIGKREHDFARGRHHPDGGVPPRRSRSALCRAQSGRPGR